MKRLLKSTLQRLALNWIASDNILEGQAVRKDGVELEIEYSYL